MLPSLDLETGEIVEDERVREAEEFTAGLGPIWEGGYRLIAYAQRRGYPQALGLTTEEWVNERLGGYVRLAFEERREIAAELAEEGMTQREIAAVLGVGQATVHRDLDSFESEDEEIPDSHTDSFPPDDSFESDKEEDEPEKEPGVGADSIDILEVAYAITDDAGRQELDWLKYRLSLFKALERASKLLGFHPEHVAAALGNDEKKTEINSLVRLLTKWSKEIDELQGQGLRLVKGEDQHA